MENNHQRAEEIAGALAELLARAGPLEVADEALKMARQGLALVTCEAAPVLWARLNLRIGTVATVAGYDRGDLAMLREAVAANAAALTVCTQESDPVTWFNAEHNHALGLLYIGELTDNPEPMEKAAERLRSVLRTRPANVPGRQWANAINSLGAASQHIGLTKGQTPAIRRAIACYRAAARVYTHAGHPEDARRLTYNQGVAFTMLGDLSGEPSAYDRAIATFETVRANMPRERNLREWANISNSIAQARANRASVTGEPAALVEAMAECEAVLDAMPRAQYPTWWAMAMVSLCDFRLRLASLRGDPAGFLAAAEGARSAFAVASAEATPAYWTALMRIAADARLRLGLQMGDPAQVEQAIALAGEVIATDGSGPREQAAMLALRGRAALRLATLRPEDAEATLGRALDDLDAALALTDRAAAPGLWAGICQVRAETLGLDGTRARDPARLEKAIGDFEAVLATLPEAETSQQRGIARAGLARTRLARALAGGGGNALDIAEGFRAARADLREDLDLAASIGAGRGQAAALLLAGSWEEAAAEASSVIERAAALIAAEPTEHARLWLAEALTGTGDIAAYALLRLGQVDQALARHEQGRAHRLRARIRLAEAALDTSRAAEIDRLRRRAELARRALAQAIEADRPAAAVERLSTALACEHRKLGDAMADAGLGDTAVAPTLAMMRGIMPEGVVALPIVTAAGGAVLILGGTATGLSVETVWLDDLNTLAVDDLLVPADGDGWLGAYAQFRGALADGTGSSSRAAVAAFQAALARTTEACWTLLMEPLDRQLRSRGLAESSEVVLIPDGRLSALPLHAAGTNSTTFLDHWAVSYAPSLAALAACRHRATASLDGPERLLTVTDPSLDLGRLVNPAAAAVPADRVDALHGAAATRAAVMKALPDAGYASFFTHAEWDPEHPERSALRLADGERLTAEDFAALDLHGCRMVVLGACESGVPGLRIAADEFRGMPAALLEAGIPGVLATLWPVFTDAADRIIADFFRHHLGEGLPPAQALRRAQIALRQDRAVADIDAAAMGVRRTEASGTAPAKRDLSLPAYWAAFAYIGA